MGMSLERRFERYCDGIVSSLMHADREQPARWYMKGLMLPGKRKSVEPMAARVLSFFAVMEPAVFGVIEPLFVADFQARTGALFS